MPFWESSFQFQLKNPVQLLLDLVVWDPSIIDEDIAVILTGSANQLYYH